MAIDSKNATNVDRKKPQIFLGEIGVIKLEGGDALALVQRLSTGDVRPLAQEDLVRDTLFVTAQGRAFAWASLFVEKGAVFVLVHPTKAAHLAVWLDTYTIMDDVVTSDVSAQFARAIVFQQPSGDTHASSPRAPAGCTALSRLSCCENSPGPSWEGLRALGSPRIYLLPANERAHVGALAQQKGYVVIDGEALAHKMIRAGVPRDDDELKDEVNPFEMRLGPTAISWNKGCYIGQEVLSRLDSYDKVARLTMGLILTKAAHKVRLEDRGAYRLIRDERMVGRVLSWAICGEDIFGLALVKRTDATEGPVGLRAALDLFEGQLCDRPFWTLA